MASIGDILARVYPGKIWAVSGDNYSSLRWMSEGEPPPEQEIRAHSDAVDTLMARERMVVTPRQFRLALLAAGLLGDCEALVAGAAEEVRITWNFATSIERTSPLIDQFAVQLGKTPAEVDAIFEAAAQIGG